MMDDKGHNPREESNGSTTQTNGIAPSSTTRDPRRFYWADFDPAEFDLRGDNTLIEELVTYKNNLQDLMRHHKDEFVLIKGKRIEGFFGTQFEALDAAVDRFGTEPALVKRVVESEEYVTFGGIIY